MLKKCAKCKKEKRKSDFCKNKNQPDGLAPVCRECNSEYGKAYREANKESLAKDKREYNKNNREYKAKYNKGYRTANKEAITKVKKEYYINNREKDLAKSKKYRVENKNKIVERRKKYFTGNILWAQEYKEKRGCKVCGIKDYRLLVFHHRKPEEKEFSIFSAIGTSLIKIKKEVKKCDVLCANCHALIHWEMKMKRRQKR